MGYNYSAVIFYSRMRVSPQKPSIRDGFFILGFYIKVQDTPFIALYGLDKSLLRLGSQLIQGNFCAYRYNTNAIAQHISVGIIQGFSFPLWCAKAPHGPLTLKPQNLSPLRSNSILLCGGSGQSKPMLAYQREPKLDLPSVIRSNGKKHNGGDAS